jgi:hypothetical protein
VVESQPKGNKMKFKTTKKAIEQGYANIKCAGYCDLQSLLKFHEPIAYTCGTYGWNFDLYVVHGVAICTGYRGMAGTRLVQISDYEILAKNILNSDLSYEERKEKIEELLAEFCEINGGY